MKKRILKTLLVEPDSKSLAYLQPSLESIRRFDIHHPLVFEANQTFSSLLGYKPAQVIGFPVIKFIHWDKLKEDLNNIFSMDNYSLLGGEGVRKDGSRFQAEFRGKTTRFNGKTIQVFIVRDCACRHVRLPFGARASG